MSHFLELHGHAGFPPGRLKDLGIYKHHGMFGPKAAGNPSQAPTVPGRPADFSSIEIELSTVLELAIVPPRWRSLRTVHGSHLLTATAICKSHYKGRSPPSRLPPETTDRK